MAQLLIARGHTWEEVKTYPICTMEAFVASILRLDASDLKQDTVSRMIAARGTGQNFSEYMKNLDKALITNKEREEQAGDGLALLRAFKSNFDSL